MDGGGLASDADWLSPRAGVDFFAGLRRRFVYLAAELGLVGRLLSHARRGSEDSFFTAAEASQIRFELVDFVNSHKFSNALVMWLSISLFFLMYGEH